MGIRKIGIGRNIMPGISSARKGGGTNWASYWATLISATVENAAPTNIILTFPSEKDIIATDLTCTVNGSNVVVNSATWVGSVLTVVIASAVTYGDVVIITFLKTGQTKAVTNNVLSYSFLLTATGAGTGVNTLIMTCSANVVLTLDGTARFYSDALGTLNESLTWTLTTGSDRTRYIRCPSGTANLKFADITKITKWGSAAAGNGWQGTTNCASISGNIGKLVNIFYVRGIIGNNTLSGSISALTGLTYFNVAGSATISGSISALINLVYFNVTATSCTFSGDIGLTAATLSYFNFQGVNCTIFGDVSAKTSLVQLLLAGSNAITGSVAALILLTTLNVTGNNTLSGSVTLLTSLTVLSCAGYNTLSGDLSSHTSLTILTLSGYNTVGGDLGVNNVVNGTTINISPCGMNTYTAGATWSNVNITINPKFGYGYSSTEIDNILIDMAASVALISKTITLKGWNAARTAASNAAVATLTGVGRTNTLVLNEDFGNGKIILSSDGHSDDFSSGMYDALVDQGILGTFYIPTSLIGGSGGFSWAQLQTYQAAGMDIQCHSHSHADLTTLTKAQIEADLDTVASLFVTNSLPSPLHHAYPFGSYNATVIDAVDGKRLSARAAYLNVNTYIWTPQFKDISKYAMQAYSIDYTDDTKLIEIQSLIDAVIAVKGVLILYTHGVVVVQEPSSITRTYFDAIIDYAQAAGMDFLTISQFYALL
jgi:peptidoglycan/xylan/chitin deacetylase (PgdA/CDA1 family)